jgi:hypothetical protein
MNGKNDQNLYIQMAAEALHPGKVIGLGLISYPGTQLPLAQCH